MSRHNAANGKHHHGLNIGGMNEDLRQEAKRVDKDALFITRRHWALGCVKTELVQAKPTDNVQNLSHFQD